MKITQFKDRVKKFAVDTFKLGKFTRKLKQARLPKNDKFVPALLKHLDADAIYTYCLNNDGSLFIAETSHESFTKSLLSKHIRLCGPDPCISGELRFVGSTMVFDNDSGTYKPTGAQLQSLRRALPFADIQIKVTH